MLKIIIVCSFTIFGIFYGANQLANFTRAQRILGTVICGIAAFAIGFLVIPNFSSNDSNKLEDDDGRAYAQCSSCDTKYYSDAFDNENYRSIRNTSMCKRCFKNFKDVKDAYDHYKLNN